MGLENCGDWLMLHYDDGSVKVRCDGAVAVLNYVLNGHERSFNVIDSK